ncbi:tyrosine-type recombinase/integrase [Muricauda sp. HICW]|uniref:Tyrosine-type recombinase/integrase n=1 Tax=Flagellimonas chongwuensis TaxID=2697365 RepID=A0A850N8A7_9FLAO|nr:site-specific integrase [Allomuricauda chongwuensis]NVN17481.1 tyrosine-type recombinase/integrase [Allomuricauda chongwuensis]
MQAVQRSKGTIRFTFKESMANLKKEPKKESLIMLHFNYGRGQRFKYSTGYYSCFLDWDLKKQRIRNKAHILNGGYVNDYLNMLETELYKEISTLDANGIPVTNKHLKQKLDQVTGKSQPKDIDEPIGLYKYMDKFLDHKKGKIADVTLRSYKQTKKLLERFNPNLDFDGIDLKFYDDFVLFLEEDDKSLNTIGKHIKNLKVFLRGATQDGVNKNMVFTRSDFKAPKEQTTAIYLSLEELGKIENLDLKDSSKKELARDIFIIGCHTGQRVSDYNGLTKNNIVELERNSKKVKFFKIKQKKTGKEVYCPITKSIKNILKKPRYGGAPPPKMNEQEINEEIKKIGHKAGIKEKIVLEYTRGGKKEIETEFKYNLIGTHTARRSFCTNMYLKGMPVFDIMHFSGHTTEKEFYKYIRVEKEERTLNIVSNGFFEI